MQHDDDPSGNPPPRSPMFRPDISAIEQGDRRIEFRPGQGVPPPPAAEARSFIGRKAADAGGFLLILGWGAAMSLLAFNVGVSHGIEKGIAACAAGDAVAIDPAVMGGVE